MLGGAEGWLVIIGAVGWAGVVLGAAVGAETTSTGGKVTKLMSVVIYMTDENASANTRLRSCRRSAICGSTAAAVDWDFGDTVSKNFL